MKSLEQIGVNQAVESIDAAFAVLQAIISDANNGLRVSKEILSRIQAATNHLTDAHKALGKGA